MTFQFKLACYECKKNVHRVNGLVFTSKSAFSIDHEFTDQSSVKWKGWFSFALKCNDSFEGHEIDISTQKTLNFEMGWAIVNSYSTFIWTELLIYLI